MTDFELAITSGGDERIELKEGNLNKYFLNPNDSEGLLSRAFVHMLSFVKRC